MKDLLQSVANHCPKYDKTLTNQSGIAKSTSCNNCTHWDGYCSLNVFDTVVSNIATSEAYDHLTNGIWDGHNEYASGYDSPQSLNHKSNR